MAKNADKLHAAKDAKKDEFYTQLEDINAEMVHYEKQFKGKTVLMNCDDPTWSNFWRYFHIEFERLGLKKIIATHYEYGEVASYKMEYTGGNDEDFEVGVKTHLEGNGDFRNQECIDLLKESNIVVTNPPFSLFREYVAQLMEYNKKFIIIGSQNAFGYKEIFPYIMQDKMWTGINNGDMSFKVPADSEPKKVRYWVDEAGQKWRSLGNIAWFTNLDIEKRHEKLILWKNYTPEEYPKYDNYDAINVDKYSDIPKDYDGIMGVPITFLYKYNPDQFEILGTSRYHDGQDFSDDINFINGKGLYTRILIRKKKYA